MKRALIIGMITMFAWACSDDTEPNIPKKDSSLQLDVGATVDKGATADKGMTVDKGMIVDKNMIVDNGVDKSTATPDKGAAADDSSSSSFSTVVWPILKSAGCNGSYCHGGTAGGLSMSSESVAYSNLVGVKSTGCTSLNRIEASDVAKSYVVQKIEGKGSCFTGQKMPVGGTLTASQISTIKAWITAGAAK